ncbi:MAG: DUF58 domain-containing protein, partial [Pseudomonadota bacterium]
YSLTSALPLAHPQRGLRRSLRQGDGLEFSQYRAYQPGDDLRRVDWRLYARSDKFYVREAPEDRRLSILFCIDTTNSMQLRDLSGQTRLASVCRLVAALGWLAIWEQAAVGAIAPGSGDVLPEGQGWRHYERLLRWLSQLQPRGSWPDWGTVQSMRPNQDSRNHTLVLSDFLDDHHAQLPSVDWLWNVAARGSAVQYLLPQELDWQFGGVLTIVDPETGQRIKTDGTELKRQYAARLQRRLQQLERHVSRQGVRLIRASSDTSPRDVLQAILAQNRSVGERLLVGGPT